MTAAAERRACARQLVTEHEHTVIDLSTADPVGGERCRHDMVATWCANCPNLPDVPLLDRPDEREVY